MSSPGPVQCKENKEIVAVYISLKVKWMRAQVVKKKKKKYSTFLHHTEKCQSLKLYEEPSFYSCQKMYEEKCLRWIKSKTWQGSCRSGLHEANYSAGAFVQLQYL